MILRFYSHEFLSDTWFSPKDFGRICCCDMFRFGINAVPPKKLINNGSVEVKDWIIPITEALLFDHWLTSSTTFSLRSERAKISLKVVPTPLTILEQKN